MRDGVKATGVNEASATLFGRGVVLDVHQVHELGLTGEVDVVGAGFGAGPHYGLPVQDVGTDGRHHNAGRFRHGLYGCIVGVVNDNDRDLATQGCRDGFQLGPVTTGEGQFRVSRSVGC